MPSIADLRRIALDYDACTVDEAAGILGTTESTVYNLVFRGHVKVLSRFGNFMILSKSSVLAYKDTHPNIGKRTQARVSKEIRRALEMEAEEHVPPAEQDLHE